MKRRQSGRAFVPLAMPTDKEVDDPGLAGVGTEDIPVPPPPTPYARTILGGERSVVPSRPSTPGMASIAGARRSMGASASASSWCKFLPQEPPSPSFPPVSNAASSAAATAASSQTSERTNEPERDSLPVVQLQYRNPAEKRVVKCSGISPGRWRHDDRGGPFVRVVERWASQMRPPTSSSSPDEPDAGPGNVATPDPFRYFCPCRFGSEPSLGFPMDDHPRRGNGKVSPHCMIDIETLGTSMGSVIVSIVAVAFDPTTGDVIDTFYVVVDRASCFAIGLTVDKHNFAWWCRQSAEARKALEQPGMPIVDCLCGLSTFVAEHAFDKVWSFGTEFDIAMLRLCYERVGLFVPWHYKNVMCARTLLYLFHEEQIARKTVEHNALEDALFQAKFTAGALAFLKDVKRNRRDNIPPAPLPPPSNVPPPRPERGSDSDASAS